MIIGLSDDERGSYVGKILDHTYRLRSYNYCVCVCVCVCVCGVVMFVRSV